MPIQEFLMDEWHAPVLGDALEALEDGRVLLFPKLAFRLEPAEMAALHDAPHASLDAGAAATGAVPWMLRRFSTTAAQLVDRLFPRYQGRVRMGRASVVRHQPADARLQLDSWTAEPTGGRRILRLFSNVDPQGGPQTWKVGERYERVAERYAAGLRLPFPGLGHLLALLRVTRTPRTAYDALMLQLREAMMADHDFQEKSPQERADFAAGSTWLAFTDEVIHADAAGQDHASPGGLRMEQTFLLPVDAMRWPERSPLRILSRLKGRPLA